MNLERIAEIEASFSRDGIADGDLRDLCRLARLGLRVEQAPLGRIAQGSGQFLAVYAPKLSDDLRGKRVALVVLEDAK